MEELQENSSKAGKELELRGQIICCPRLGALLLHEELTLQERNTGSAAGSSGSTLLAPAFQTVWPRISYAVVVL